MKRTLSYDTSRCSGRHDFEPVGGWCPERDTCQRYLAFTSWDKEAGLEDYQLIPVTMARKDCEHKIEVIELSKGRSCEETLNALRLCEEEAKHE